MMRSALAICASVTHSKKHSGPGGYYVEAQRGRRVRRWYQAVVCRVQYDKVSDVAKAKAPIEAGKKIARKALSKPDFSR